MWNGLCTARHDSGTAGIETCWRENSHDQKVVTKMTRLYIVYMLPCCRYLAWLLCATLDEIATISKNRTPRFSSIQNPSFGNGVNSYEQYQHIYQLNRYFIIHFSKVGDYSAMKRDGECTASCRTHGFAHGQKWEIYSHTSHQWCQDKEYLRKVWYGIAAPRKTTYTVMSVFHSIKTRHLLPLKA